MFVSGSEKAVDRHLRTKEHICNVVYNLWLDPTEILKGEEPYTCSHCYKMSVYLAESSPSFAPVRSTNYSTARPIALT